MPLEIIADNLYRRKTTSDSSLWKADSPDLPAARRERERLALLRPALETRARAMTATRDFFTSRGFLEVQTPVRIPTPALEDYIEAIPSGKHWLRTSPEFHMKRLLAAGYDKIFQLGPCFRRDEMGTRHLTEFTMLEWYRADAHWLDVQHDCAQLLTAVARATGPNTRHFRNRDIDLTQPWELITVEDAFNNFANRELDACIRDGLFEQVLVESVEPNLGINGRPTALTEYPLACSGLSKQIPGRPERVERWELYACGLEIGNACSELADPHEQIRRFRECTALRHREHRIEYPLDQPFMDAMRAGMPQAAGVAIGMDRLFMLLTGLDDISGVNAFV